MPGTAILGLEQLPLAAEEDSFYEHDNTGFPVPATNTE
jgi:hypothetical protein